MANIITNKASVTSTYTLPNYTKQTNNVESNTVTTENLSEYFFKTKSASKIYAVSSQQMEISLILTNISTHTLSNMFIIDTVIGDATFLENSLKINNQSYPYEDPTFGFNLPVDIAPQDEPIEIAYSLIVDDEPTTNNITIVTNLNYDIEDGSHFTENSNIVNLQVVKNHIAVSGNFNKTAVISGQQLKQTSTITNLGNLINKELIFTNPAPQGTAFVAGSVEIDNELQPELDPTKGINLSDLNPNDKITISFNLQVE